ncbi:MAG: glycosyltransferase [Clostridia bacterium]|nr:glycosyltransferase [Clostridia bacterium]
MISVVLAAYKGEKYISEQVKSILAQLGENDELIISDDYPQGNTFSSIENIISSDRRVRYIHGPGRGLIKNFEYAISESVGDYIFLSDQDDVWMDGKVDAVLNELESGADVVLHDALITDSALNPTGETAFALNHSRKGIVSNIIKNSYQGSCMAFRRSLVEHILPFPDKLPMHDQWIGLIGEKYGVVRFLNKPYILYRRHNEAVSGGGSSLMQKIKWRLDITGCFLRR